MRKTTCVTLYISILSTWNTVRHGDGPLWNPRTKTYFPSIFKMFRMRGKSSNLFEMTKINLVWFKNRIFRAGVRSRSWSRSRPESWHRARSRSRSRSRSNWLDSDSGTFCLNLRYNLSMQGRHHMQFLEIICADIAFKLYRYTHIRIKRWRGAMTFKGGSNGPNAALSPKAHETGTKLT